MNDTQPQIGSTIDDLVALILEPSPFPVIKEDYVARDDNGNVCGLCLLGRLYYRLTGDFPPSVYVVNQITDEDPDALDPVMVVLSKHFSLSAFVLTNLADMNDRDVPLDRIVSYLRPKGAND